MIRFLQSLLLLLAFVFVAPSSAAATRSDQSSTTTLRLVTLSPNLTEIAFALGRGEQVVGVTTYCRWPEEADQRQQVGALYDLNTELVLSLRPTHVLHTSDHRGAIDRLRSVGVQTEHLPVESIADIQRTITRMGELLGSEAQATKLNQGISADFAALQAAHYGKPRIRTLLVVDNPSGELRQIYVLGPGTFLHAMLEAIGCENVMEGSKAFYPQVSREYLIAHPPQLVITSTDQATAEMKAEWKKFLGGREDVVFLYRDDPHLMIPGPSIGRKARELSEEIERVFPRP
jgi:iron complex transport system substrate-binding protein